MGESNLYTINQGSGIFLLENLRFYRQEEEGSEQFAYKLSQYGDVFVNDAFGAVHRPHASISKINLPVRVAGLLLARELEMFNLLLAQSGCEVAILGGAKVADKTELIEQLLTRVKKVLVGGAMAVTFVKKLGQCGIGASRFDEKGAAFVLEIMKRAEQLGVDVILPIDFRCAKSLDDGEEVTVCKVDGEGVPDGYSAYDIGPLTETAFSTAIHHAKSVLWNGPMGVFESKQFSHGTTSLIDALDQCTGVTVVGGGDTAAAVSLLRPEARLTHVSTGGGASLELMEGRVLPGVVHLEAKDV
jgi:phosphoglycerate kinase